jgi:hypothetical protein
MNFEQFRILEARLEAMYEEMSRGSSCCDMNVRYMFDLLISIRNDLEATHHEFYERLNSWRPSS